MEEFIQRDSYNCSTFKACWEWCESMWGFRKIITHKRNLVHSWRSKPVCFWFHFICFSHGGLMPSILALKPLQFLQFMYLDVNPLEINGKFNGHGRRQWGSSNCSMKDYGVAWFHLVCYKFLGDVKACSWI